MEINSECLAILRHIMDARIDNASSTEAYISWTSARDIIEYALAGNIDCLRQFDYLMTHEETLREYEGV